LDWFISSGDCWIFYAFTVQV